MNIKIKNAILHILKNDGNPSLFSENELDLDSEVCEAFIGKHVQKLWNNPSAREATFRADSPVYSAVRSYIEGAPFKETARFLASRLSDILNKYVDIPPSDVLIVRFDVKADSYLAVFKLNYKECITHEAAPGDNQLVKYRKVLPFDSGKVEEACLIPFSPMLIKLIEKPHLIDGTPVCYFSEMFLECDASLSRKETVQIINEVAGEFIEEHSGNDIRSHAVFKTAITEEAEEAEGIVSMDNVAGRLFPEDAETKQRFVETMREAGIVADQPLGAKFVRQQFSTQKIKSDNGVEVKFPAELVNDEGQIELTNHSDGTVTVVLKRLRVVD